MRSPVSGIQKVAITHAEELWGGPIRDRVGLTTKRMFKLQALKLNF